MSNEVTSRSGMSPVGDRIRAYFAPVDRVNDQPAIFDPANHGRFPLDVPPPPWIDMGWVEHFQRTSTSILDEVHTGPQGCASVQYRRSVGAAVEVDFCDWGKLQMALSAGTQHMNVLASDSDSSAQPMGGTPTSAIAVLPGSTADEIILGSGAVDPISPGDVVAVDIDYQQQVGYVGTGIAAAYIADPDDIHRDVHYIRRVTFNVGTVKEKTATSLLLSQPMPGGAPNAMSGLQRVVAFVDRDGGNFLQEWSALFIAGRESGGRICYYYPRLRPAGSLPEDAGSTPRKKLETVAEFGETFTRTALHASFTARAILDDIDSEPIVCYRSYFPQRSSPMY